MNHELTMWGYSLGSASADSRSPSVRFVCAVAPSVDHTELSKSDRPDPTVLIMHHAGGGASISEKRVADPHRTWGSEREQDGKDGRCRSLTGVTESTVAQIGTLDRNDYAEYDEFDGHDERVKNGDGAIVDTRSHMLCRAESHAEAKAGSGRVQARNGGGPLLFPSLVHGQILVKGKPRPVVFPGGPGSADETSVSYRMGVPPDFVDVPSQPRTGRKFIAWWRQPQEPRPDQRGSQAPEGATERAGLEVSDRNPAIVRPPLALRSTRCPFRNSTLSYD